MKSSMTFALFLTIGTTVSARAQPVHDSSARQSISMYSAITIGGGYLHHWQLDPADLQMDGGVVSFFHGTAGINLSEEIALGLGVAFHPALIPLNTPTETLAFVPLGLIGPMIAVLPDGSESIVSYEGVLGFAFGGGPPGTFGGFGGTISNGFLIHALRWDDIHLTLGIRCLLGILSSGVGGTGLTLGVTADVGVSLFPV